MWRRTRGRDWRRGATIEEAALEVGISGTSVCRWLAAYVEPAVAVFDEVEIVAAEADEESRRILVHGPAGLVIEVLSGELFAFINKRRKRAKVLWWDGTGLCLLAKRLEEGRFMAPWLRSGEGPLPLRWG